METEVKLNPGEFRMVAKTMQGLEEVLERELLKIGAREIEQHKRAVSFIGDKGTMYKANYLLRTALRILRPVATFKALNEKEFYDGIRAIDWTQWLTADDTLAVDTTLNTEIFNHSYFISQKTKDAIVDQFRDKFGKRPSVDTEFPTLRINIHVSREDVNVSLDSSGYSLHKRGYRQDTGVAPMNEVLAAGIIMLTGWNGRTRLIDPMCGSGTIPIEAALMANNIPPGYFREKFGFEKWNDFDAELWEKITDAALDRISSETQDIIGLEISRTTLRKARENIHSAKVEDIVKTENADFFEWDPPEGRGMLIMNPPYGERMDQDDSDVFYKQIGDTFKKKYSGYEAWLITSNMEALKVIGLRPSRKITLFNGPLECRLMKYEMYAGTKKVHKLEPGYEKKRPRIEKKREESDGE
ncbi:MAG TPA: THUMP domain-containing protein [Bacteroidia bacterium]|jgi:putative N6-adenine-specific DNA methylase|nr:THUMP domain-containing protein [Bacteroidia bacterium]